MAAFLLLAVSMSAQTADAGKKLFKDYCASCHAKNMKSDLTGPALGGVQDRWDDEADLYSWIRNSQAMIASGHPRATELWNKWKPTVMTSFEALTDEEIASMLLYIDGVYTGTYGAPKATAATASEGAVVKEKSLFGNWIYPVLLVILALLALFLAYITTTLDALAKEREGLPGERKTIMQILTSKGVLGFLIFGLIIFAGYTTVSNAVNLGRQQGYQPDQPIKFSHETHAGVQGIDCQYCHDGARRSKHSVIPATNTCMNCHSAIKVGSKYGTAELTKIYASAGWNPNTGKYIEDVQSKSNDDLKAIYTKWIEANYLEANDLASLNADGERLVRDQWNGIVSSLTNDLRTSVYGPIEWIRIHNLPDHVYFNHAQHVTVGKVECQTCHGQVQEMDKVVQHSPLSMGWCINCHRQTGIQFGDNAYYESYAKYHEQMKNGDRDKVTVAEIGGLECQKCHY